MSTCFFIAATSHQPGKPTKITIDMLSLPNPKSLSAELNNNPKSLSAELNNNNIHTQKTTAQCMPGCLFGVLLLQ